MQTPLKTSIFCWSRCNFQEELKKEGQPRQEDENVVEENYEEEEEEAAGKGTIRRAEM